MAERMHVVKLGGSLLDCPDLGARLARWLAGQSAARNVLIVGGGQLVESIRQLAGSHHLDDEQAHWLSIRAMSVTAATVAALLPDAVLQMRLGDLETGRAGTSILDVGDFMQADRDSAEPLPASWDVTSDSIAARMAQAINADELVLLKSALPKDVALTLSELAAMGYVDRYFATAATQLRAIRLVNLRDDSFPTRTLSRQAAAK